MSSSFWCNQSDAAFQPYKCSHQSKKWKETCSHHLHHSFPSPCTSDTSSTQDGSLSCPLCCQNSRPHRGLRRWARKQDSCLCLQKVPWPLSRASYHLLDVSVGLESQNASDTVSAIEEKGGIWSCLFRKGGVQKLWLLAYYYDYGTSVQFLEKQIAQAGCPCSLNMAMIT